MSRTEVDSTTQLLFATANAGKLAELEAMCAPLGLIVASVGDHLRAQGDAEFEVEEDGDTFLANALKKAAAAYHLTGLSVISDDSGLSVDALGGAPGVHSARFSGEDASDDRNCELLLERLAGAGPDRRGAAFHCTLVLCGPIANGEDAGRLDDGTPWRAFVGTVRGEILSERRGDGGFGYDPLFYSPELGAAFGDADRAAKARVSHRGRAFARLGAYLTARSRLSAKEPLPLFVRPVGLEALGHALAATFESNLRHADRALEATVRRDHRLGSKERGAVVEVFFHAIRRLGFLQLAGIALQGGPRPESPPDPRDLRPRDARVVAALALASVDPYGRPCDGKDGSALHSLVSRNPDLASRMPATPHQLAKALRTARHVAAEVTGPAGLALRLGCPLELVEACAPTDQPDLERALTYQNRRGPLTLRANALRCDRELVRKRLGEAELELLDVPGLDDALLCLEHAPLTGLSAFDEGLFEVQDAGSQSIVAMVAASPGETIADWCAGAGGKTLALAAAMRNRGRLFACDVHDRRLAECQRRLRRAGVHNTTTRHLTDDDREDETMPFFDAVLVDAPCSGTGALRRNPELRWHLDAQWLARFPDLQLAILRRAAARVRAGGRLIYATCSILPAENEGVVRRFLDEARNFSFSDEKRMGPADPALLRTFPLAQIGPDGFYCAVLRRGEDDAQASETTS